MDNSPQNDHRALLKRSLVALDEMQAKVDALEKARSEPIAVIGMACRFPGGADSPEKFWRLLYKGVDAVTEVPKDRWDVAAYYDPNPDAIGKTYTRWGAFIEQVDLFDPQFFGITPREANSMDPQQRLLLEVAWEALENAGQSTTKLSESLTGVYVGMSGTDYAANMSKTNNQNIDAYFASGVAHSIATGRISYFLGVHGPSLAVDTACSSSLVAVHLAVQALRSGECNMALAGGVNLMLSVDGSIATSRARMMSFDGLCKTFDASADGYVRGEGGGMVVLKRLSEAIADGDTIHAVIRGTALNQDGRSNGLTAPNGAAQEAVIRAALDSAGAKPEDISYVEAHGTGTTLGDPIEINALGRVYGAGRDKADSFYIASAKTNIGHLEAAAGIVGLIKVVLSLQNKTIPPHLHFTNPNPYIRWDNLPIKVPVEPTPWKTKHGAPRLAGLSSFGFSGTNAHVILAEAPISEAAVVIERPLHILTVSAKTPSALSESVARLEDYLSENPDASLADIGYTANTGRTHFEQRLAILTDSSAEASNLLATWRAGNTSTGLISGSANIINEPEVVFLFTGQGSQYLDMGRQLYETQPTFRKILDKCAEILLPYLEQPLLSVIFKTDGTNAKLLNDTAYTQPALFAIEYALAQLWRSWGVEPSVVMGHSVGEYVAACIAGIFSLEDGLRLIAERGRLMSKLPAGGVMAAIFATESQVAEAIAAYSDEVSIAAINGPNNIVISGAGDTVQFIVDKLKNEGIKSQQLTVSHAFHSPLMDPVLDEFEQIVASVQFSQPQIGLISNVSGQLAGDEVLTPAYWRTHVRQAVRFSDSIQSLYQQGYRLYLEIGPSPTLLGMGRRCLEEDAGVWLPSLRKVNVDWQSMLDSLGHLYVNGVDINWSGFERDYAAGRKLLALPTYPFQRQRYWLELESMNAGGTAMTGVPTGNSLLGSRLRMPFPIFEAQISTAYQPFLADHEISGLTLLPSTAYVEMALVAAEQAFGAGGHTLDNLVIKDPLVVPNDGTSIVQTILNPEKDGQSSFQIFSHRGDTNKDQWQLHMSGNIVIHSAALTPPEYEGVDKVLSRCTKNVDAPAYYEKLRSLAANYGERFRGLKEIWRRDGEAIGRIELADSLREDNFKIHPVFLDACFHIMGLGLLGAGDLEGDHIYVPIGLKEVRLYRKPTATAWSHVIIHTDLDKTRDSFTGSFYIINDDGNVAIEVVDLELKRISRLSNTHLTDWLYQIEWQSQPQADVASVDASGRWLILADQDGIAERLAMKLQEHGGQAELIYPASSNGASSHKTLDPADPDAFQNLVAQLEDAANPLKGAIYLWGESIRLGDAASRADLQAAQEYVNGSALYLVQALAKAKSTARLWLVTAGGQAVLSDMDYVEVVQSSLWGLGSVVAAELPDLRCSRFDLDPAEQNANSHAQALFNEITAANAEDHIAVRDHNRYVARLNHAADLAESQSAELQQHYELQISERGVLDNLTFAPMTRQMPGPGEVEIEVYATGLNFRDVLNALGMYPGDAGPLGNECSGIISAVGEGVTNVQVGDEVMAMSLRGFASYVIAVGDLVIRKPNNLSFEQAAGVPIIFLTAMYGLNNLAHMTTGDRVLIHAAAGGVGMAAIQLARLAGAEIFGTAGNPEKRAIVQEMGVHHVMSSRTLDFSKEIAEITGGEGVDIVLNSLAGDFIPHSLSIMKDDGCFIEIGKTDVWGEKEVHELKPNLDYYVLYLGEICASDSKLIQSMLVKLVEMFETGVLQPLPLHLFPIDEVGDAFRFMAQAKHIGKIVVTQKQNTAPLPVYPDASYLITGGLGGLGLVTARWMVEQAGARHLILMGRSAPSAYAQGIIDGLSAVGAQVVIAQADIGDTEQVEHVLDEIAKAMPPLKGIMHTAGVLDDGVLTGQTWSRFAKVMNPKVDGAWNLHTLTRHTSLDFFVLFSGAAALLGSAGQSNYASANAFLDGLAHYRQSLGLPAMSINWGAWSEVGMAAGLDAVQQKRLREQGMNFINPHKGVEVLEKLMRHNRAQIVVAPINWSKMSSRFTAATIPPFFSLIAQHTSDDQTVVASSEPSLLHQLQAAPAHKRHELLVNAVREQVVKVLGLNASQMPGVRQNWIEIGMDSLMAVELSNRMKGLLGKTLPTTLAFEYPTIQALSEYLSENVLNQLDNENEPLVNHQQPPSELPTTQEIEQQEAVQLLENLEGLSDEEVEALLRRL